jgi:nitric oxide reductase subunit B
MPSIDEELPSTRAHGGIRSTLSPETRDLMNEDPVTRVLKWVLLATAVICFGLIAWATGRTYQDAPMQPDRFVTPDQTTLLTGADIVAGKAGFQKADLMDYGSLCGMGSYFGPDYTAQNLVALASATEQNLAGDTYNKDFSVLAADQQAAVKARMQDLLHGVDLTQPVVTVPPALAQAIVSVRDHIAAGLMENNFAEGYSKARSLDPQLARQTADFLIYASLTTVAHRPGTTVSWTQNWPYEPIVGNSPSAATFIWTWASFCFIFFGFGAVLAIYKIFLSDPDVAPMDPVLVGFRALTPSQRSTGKYFLFVALVFLLQIGAGSVTAHYYSDRTSFYGIPVGVFLPYNFLRSVHIQAPFIWIAVSWIGSGLFLAPLISGREATHQALLVDILFWASLIVVAAALIGNYLGIMGLIDRGWFWFGNQGLSYLQIGRFWQIAFFGALVMWSWLIARALWPSRSLWNDAARHFWTGRIRLEHLIWAPTVNVAVLYVFGMIPLTGIESSFTITDYWRWWVVHLWVEQSFEFYAVTMSIYLLMGLGLVSRHLAERGVFLELILIFLGGVLGTGHHLYWNGSSGLWIPFGTMFSFIEVLPLVLLILESIEQRRIIARHQQFQYGLAYTYVIGAAFWNFVGAGVFGGGTLNTPLVNYYEHGTFLTLNHAHTALFGAFGLLGIGLVYFCPRYLAGDLYAFSEKAGYAAFWLYNGSLVLWILLNFFPIGWAQLSAVHEHGLTYARSLAFYDTTLLWQWLRIVGDVVFAAGALIMAFDFLMKRRPVLPDRLRNMLPDLPGVIPGAAAQSSGAGVVARGLQPRS